MSLRVNFRNDNEENLYREVRCENLPNFSIRFLSESHKVEDEKLKQVQLDKRLKDSSINSE